MSLCSSPRSRYTVSAVCGLLFLAVTLVFGKSVLNDFVNFDDAVLVYKNPIVARGVTAQGVAWACTANVSNMWYPLTLISYMLDSQVYGLKPWGYHLTNVLLHAATTVILFVALYRMTGDLWASALATLLFAIHPLRVEAVAWVGERKSPLSGLFFVLTIAAYVAYARRPLSLARYLAVAGMFTLGLLAKPTIVTLPILLLLLDYWPLGRWPVAIPGARQEANDSGTRRESVLWLVLEKIPLLFLSVACSVAAVLTQADNLASLESVPIPARIANALISYAVYLGQFFWPVKLAAFYPRVEGVPAWQVASASLVLAVLSLAALVSWRKQPAVLVGWLWYLGALVPMIGLVSIGKHARADRYTYLPQIGLCIAVVWGVRWAVERLCSDWPARRWLYGIGDALVVAGLMACAWQQTSYWHDSETLWSHTLDCTSQNPLAWNNLGLALADRGQFEEAFTDFRKALEIDPDYALAHYSFGVTLAGRGRLDEAIVHYRKALDIDPDYALGHYNLGNALVGRGQLDEAIDHYRKALDIKPDSAAAHYNLGVALAGRGELDEAIGHYRKALEIEPGDADAHNNFGAALAGRGEFDEAIIHFQEALKIKPGDPQTHNNLGLALAGRGQVDEAITHFQKALEIDPDYLSAHYSFGITLAGCGRFDEALAHYRKALLLASARNDMALADAIRAQIKLLQSGAPAGKTP